MSEPINRPLVGMAWMFLTGVLFIGVTAIVKYVGDGLPPAESAFLRYVIGLVFFIPIIGEFKKVKLSRRDLKLFACNDIDYYGRSYSDEFSYSGFCDCRCSNIFRRKIL
jgi:hypothetical protein